MKYSETLANRVREKLVHHPKIEEKQMFGCLAFMVDDKLCICIQEDGLVLRINPEQEAELLEKTGCREMKMGKRIMHGYVHVDEVALQTQFGYWTGLALEYNKQARASKKAKAKSKKAKEE